jgi:hypothetical protein
MAVNILRLLLEPRPVAVERPPERARWWIEVDDADGSILVPLGTLPVERPTTMAGVVRLLSDEPDAADVALADSFLDDALPDEPLEMTAPVPDVEVPRPDSFVDRLQSVLLDPHLWVADDAPVVDEVRRLVGKRRRGVARVVEQLERATEAERRDAVRLVDAAGPGVSMCYQGLVDVAGRVGRASPAERLVFLAALTRERPEATSALWNAMADAAGRATCVRADAARGVVLEASAASSSKRREPFQSHAWLGRGAVDRRSAV